MIKLLLAVVVMIVIFGALAIAVKRLGLLKPEKRSETWPFRRKDFLLTKNEKEFYQVLCKAVDGRWAVFAKVRLGDLVWLPKGVKNYQSLQNRVQSRHVDFVLCDQSSVRPRLVIELDDSSHGRPGRQSGDAVKDQVLSSAGLALLRMRARGGYAEAEVKQAVEKAMG
jgi:hypothetical protein